MDRSPPAKHGKYLQLGNKDVPLLKPRGLDYNVRKLPLPMQTDFRKRRYRDYGNVWHGDQLAHPHQHQLWVFRDLETREARLSARERDLEQREQNLHHNRMELQKILAQHKSELEDDIPSNRQRQDRENQETRFRERERRLREEEERLRKQRIQVEEDRHHLETQRKLQNDTYERRLETLKHREDEMAALSQRGDEVELSHAFRRRMEEVERETSEKRKRLEREFREKEQKLERDRADLNIQREDLNRNKRRFEEKSKRTQDMVNDLRRRNDSLDEREEARRAEEQRISDDIMRLNRLVETLKTEKQNALSLYHQTQTSLRDQELLTARLKREGTANNSEVQSLRDQITNLEQSKIRLTQENLQLRDERRTLGESINTIHTTSQQNDVQARENLRRLNAEIERQRSELSNQRVEAMRIQNEKEQQLQEARRRNDLLEQQLRQQTRQLSDLQKNEELHANVSQVTANLERLEQQETEWTKRMQAAQTQFQQARRTNQDELEKLHRKVQELTQQHTQVRTSLEEKRSQAQRYEAEVRKNKKLLMDLDKRDRDLKRREEAHRQQVLHDQQQLQQERRHANLQRQARESKMVSTRAQVEQQQEEKFSQLESEVRRLQNELDVTKGTNTSLTTKLKEQQRENESLRRNLERQSERRDHSSSKQVNDLQAKVKELQSQLKSAENNLQQKTKESQKFKNDALRNSHQMDDIRNLKRERDQLLARLHDEQFGAGLNSTFKTPTEVRTFFEGIMTNELSEVFDLCDENNIDEDDMCCFTFAIAVSYYQFTIERQNEIFRDLNQLEFLRKAQNHQLRAALWSFFQNYYLSFEMLDDQMFIEAFQSNRINGIPDYPQGLEKLLAQQDVCEYIQACGRICFFIAWSKEPKLRLDPLVQADGNRLEFDRRQHTLLFDGDQSLVPRVVTRFVFPGLYEERSIGPAMCARVFASS